MSGFLLNTRSKVVHTDHCPMRGRSRRLRRPGSTVPMDDADLGEFMRANPDVRVDPQCLGNHEREDAA